MADKEQETVHPANGYARSNDTEAAAAARERRKKKRTKCFLYIALFVILQTAIIAVFALTVMKVRTPKFRLSDATLTNFSGGTPASPSLRATMNVEFSVRNANFGRYKYRNATVEFFYRGAKVGEMLVPNSRANWRSTRQFRVDVDLNLGANNGQINSRLLSDLSAGVVPITSSAAMRGRVELMFVVRKSRSANMHCSMEIVTAGQTIRNIVCK